MEKGHLTQTWLAVSDDPAANVSGGYWNHRKQQKPLADALDLSFQDQLMAKLAELTGVDHRREGEGRRYSFVSPSA